MAIEVPDDAGAQIVQVVPSAVVPEDRERSIPLPGAVVGGVVFHHLAQEVAEEAGDASSAMTRPCAPWSLLINGALVARRRRSW